MSKRSTSNFLTCLAVYCTDVSPFGLFQWTNSPRKQKQKMKNRQQTRRLLLRNLAWVKTTLCIIYLTGDFFCKRGFTGEKCLIVRYQSTWHRVNSTWRQSRPSSVYSRRKKKNWSLPIQHLFTEWPGLVSILLFLLFCEIRLLQCVRFGLPDATDFSGYNMFPFFNGLILHKNTRCLEVILFVFSNFITE